MESVLPTLCATSTWIPAWRRDNPEFWRTVQRVKTTGLLTVLGARSGQRLYGNETKGQYLSFWCKGLFVIKWIVVSCLCLSSSQPQFRLFTFGPMTRKCGMNAYRASHHGTGISNLWWIFIGRWRPLSLRITETDDISDTNCTQWFDAYRGADKSLVWPDWKNIWKVAIFRPTRRSLLPWGPGWMDNLLNFFFLVAFKI